MYQPHIQNVNARHGRDGALGERDKLVGARARGQESLRCVSSGYMNDGCSCRSTVPAAVVDAAWEREVAHVGSREDRFFHFACEGEVWLAFGMASGEIRGVYCPTHRAEREARARSGGAAPTVLVA
jgi:hypothetical protein